jgi:glycosyltransferase involved in cell wall biosynthesis
LNDPDVELLTPYPLEPGEVAKYLNATDVFISTSFMEGSSNVIKEAMACNCPILATNVGDAAWVLGETKGCYLTSFEPQEIAAKLQSALVYSHNHNRTTGRQRIHELSLDSETTAKRIIEVYQPLSGT